MTISKSNTEELLVDQEGHILTLTLNRPHRLNAISRPMLKELSAKLVEANEDPEIRVIILTGTGRGFCSGLDLVDSRESGIGSGAASDQPRQLFSIRNAPITVMWNLDKPVIAAVNGGAAGYGMDLALLADMRIAAESAKMAAVMVKRAIVPESGGTWLLPRLIGWGKAAEIYYRGRTLNARESLEMGLVNTVVPDDQLMPTARQWAREIAENAPVAVQTTKRMMRMGMDETFDTAVDHLMVHLSGLFASEDFKEGVRSFMEKRSPKFTGR
ncbi:MAG: enoyl-CoA hydratase/isomerase family protein [Desulfobacteraceae bacterium]|nr:enoyl-CoA hydratase/isomerase family protein [Desulfobacteraceae bacterium]MBU4054355.1 enoyl-CoA hydratase/isomerase family protein [Pseudomonadota bacterium]